MRRMKTMTHHRSLLTIAAATMAFSVGASAQTKVMGLDVSIGETTIDHVDARYEIYDDSDYELTGDTSRVIPGNEIELNQAYAARVFFNDQGAARGVTMLVDSSQKPALLDRLRSRYTKASPGYRTPLITEKERYVFFGDNAQVALIANPASDRIVLLYRNKAFIQDSAEATRQKNQAPQNQ